MEEGTPVTYEDLPEELKKKYDDVQALLEADPFPAVNTAECTYPERCQPGFALGINMVEPGHHSGKDQSEGNRSRSKDKEEAAPRGRLRHDGKRYITEGEVNNVRYQRPLSDHLLNKYVSQYDQHRRYNSDDERDRLASRNARRHRRQDRDEEGYGRHAKEKSREQDDMDKHWDCPFFKHCWDSGMSRLPTIGNCPECKQKKSKTDVSVFKRLGPLPSRSKQTESSQEEDLKELEDDYEQEEDKYRRPRWCPDGLSRSQKRRFQRLRGLEEAEKLYLHTLRKARPDLAATIQRTLDEEGRPERKEWCPKQRKADNKTSAGTNMVCILPAESCTPDSDETPVAQLEWFMMMEADSSNGPILSSPCVLPMFSVDLTGDGKLGYGFTSADELEEVDIGPGDKPRPTFISKKLDPHLRSQMIALLKEYPDCFSWDYTEMPGYAEWISSIVPVEKKDGRWRVAIDFRDLNRATPKDEYPMPVAEALINAAAGQKVLSFMDGNAGYNQIFMAPEDIHKTAFRVPGSVGLFEYVVMTFGLKNAGATYQRAMNYIFHDLIGKLVEIYIDDVVVKSVSMEGHLDDLRCILDRTRKFGLRMNPKKCAFGVTAGQFLGFLVHERGIEIGLKSQEAVRTMQPPTTKKELQRLIGKINFVRRFISNLSGRIETFMALVKIKSDDEFYWGTEQQQAFDEIKRYLTTPPVLVPPQQDRPFYIYLSVADTSIASVVVQLYEGVEKVVFYLSRRMLDAETRYPEVEKLCLCLFFTCTKLHHILLTAETIVICKSDVVKHMLSAPVLKGRLGKWMFALSEFDLRYQPAKARDIGRSHS
ncbi:hypothetical protein QYE76_060019 [Lolium multiflorum]|uniref:Reverse transcriptase domain-containing protein n=1 Tax=Lolium multiflorum TaxID=4521 RepID=A0AAD8W5V2_LOLMU|nr:hypothetical protein QYE76_060019 [Lolium multiflorum]